MTIDLGFAWLRLPGGAEVSIVDVPGHERFIKNMLAGVGGIDLALLVVAADEGEALKGTSLEGAPLVACSATTRAGLDTLLQTLEARLAETAPKRDIGRPRLAIDRAFTIAGF